MVLQIRELVASLIPNTYDHAKKLVIILTNQLNYKETLIKKENTMRVGNNKMKYDSSSMGTLSQSYRKNQDTM